MSEFTKIQQDLSRLKQDNLEIKEMLLQLLHPAQSMDTRGKAKAIMDALNSGDRKHYLDVRKQLLGNRKP